MNLYISPRIGNGTYENMFQARHAETDSGRSAVHLTRGQYLLLSDTPVAGAITLGHQDEPLTLAATKAIRRIGAEVRGETMAEVAYNIRRYPTTGLPPLKPSRTRGCYSLCMKGNTLWHEPSISLKWVNTLTEYQWIKDRYIELRNEGFWHSAAWALAAPSATDDFNRANENPIVGWTKTAPAIMTVQVVSNNFRVSQTANNQDSFVRNDTALDSEDMTAEIEYRSGIGATSTRPGGGIGARKAADSNESYYYFGRRSGTTAENEGAELYLSAFDRVDSSVSYTINVGDIYQIRMEGDQFSGGTNDAVTVGPTTVLNSWASGVHAGLYHRTSTGDEQITWDNFQADIIGAPPANWPRGKPFTRPFTGPFGGPI